MHEIQIVRKRVGKRFTKPVTFPMRRDLKHRYDILSNAPHSIGVAEHLRGVMDKELDRIFADLAQATRDAETHVKSKGHELHITLWVRPDSYVRYEELRLLHPTIPRADLMRAVFETEINRLWDMENLPAKAG